MIQGYFLSCVYLVFSSLLFLVDEYREKLLFMLRIRAKLEDDKRFLSAYFYTGIVISVITLFLPIYPGPVVLGDLLVSVFTLVAAIHFKLRLSEKNALSSNLNFTKIKKREVFLGYATMVVALLHFLLPSFVIL